MLLRLWILLACVWQVGLAASGAQAAPLVVIVSSDTSAAYLETTQALVGELERMGVAPSKVRSLTVGEWSELVPLSPQLFVTLGAEAANALAKTELRSPVLCTLLPRASFEHALRLGGRKASARFSALYLDQPLSRQIELIHLALPAARRVGVLWGVEPAAEATALKALAQAQGLQLVEAAVSSGEPLFPALRQVLDNADVLLAVPNPQVYNSNTVQNILLTSFRAKVPMQAFSPAYVRAGALLSLHVTPAQVGLQAATLANAVLQGKSLPEAAVYSQDFQVSVNEHIARSFGLILDAEDLRRRLRLRERTP
jgi:ABC-type uncharacterized transport system substrate-binding protein